MSFVETPQPLTWVDVARAFAALTPADSGSSSIVRVHVGWDGLTVVTRSPGLPTDAVAEWLEGIFPGRVVKAPQLALELEGPAHASLLPVDCEIDDDPVVPRVSFGVIKGSIDLVCPADTGGERPARAVPIVAVQSVKGGTGRTTVAVAMALRWAKQVGRPILLVDADMEAPGISYLFRELRGTPRISLEDAIAMAHAESRADAAATVEFVGNKLEDHALEGDIIVLPLRRHLDELASSGIRPEHLATPERPFALGDMLGAVAEKCGCRGVVVDVRAGLVPVGVNFALDPDVATVLVTTLSHQALAATGSLAQFVSREIRRMGRRPRRPLLVVNRVPTAYQQTGMDETLIEPLVTKIIESLVAGLPRDAEADESLLENSLDVDPISVVRVPELPDLQVSTDRWDRYIEQLENSSFLGRVAESVDEWLESEVIAEDSGTSHQPESEAPASRSDHRKLLCDYAARFAAGDTLEVLPQEFVITRKMTLLARGSLQDVPIAVIEGSRGSGKTLLARFLIAKRDWLRAVVALTEWGSVARSHLLLPVCGSTRAGGNVGTEMDKARIGVGRSLGNLKALVPQDTEATMTWLRGQRDQREGEQNWSDAWLDAIAWSAGFEPTIAGAGQRFLERLRATSHKVIAVIDGLEDLYESVDQPGGSAMLRAVLVDLPLRLRAARGRPLGLLAFARPETVEASVRQDIEQYRREYSACALTWSKNDILELAAWLAAQSKAIPKLEKSFRAAQTIGKKAHVLEALWGRKLGKSDSPGRIANDADTHTWVIAALSDLRGTLAPRDLLRLLACAAGEEPTPQEALDYPDRLLVPRALRSALKMTSAAKVQEFKEEIPGMREVLNKFQAASGRVCAPIDAAAIEELGLCDTDINILKRYGILFGDAPPYEVPELFRHGLGLRHTGARHRIISLYRRARQRSDALS